MTTNPENSTDSVTDVQRFGFYLVNNFALIPFSSAIETLRMANQVAGRKIYAWDTISLDGNPVTARCGLEVKVDCTADAHNDYSVVFVCGGTMVEKYWSAALGKWLRMLAQRKVGLGALSTGSYLLARAQLLDGVRSTVHWEKLSVMREQFPRINLTDSVYEIDHNRYTSAGGTTSIDLILHLVAARCGHQLSVTISENLLIDRVRCRRDRQRIPLAHQIGSNQPVITETAALMEANVEEPLSVEELAACVQVTRRQLQRLFKMYLKCSPSQFYKRIRLNHARQLLIQTDKPVVEISVLCGFCTTAHFSTSYRKMFGLTPTEDRSHPGDWDDAFDNRSVATA